MLRIGRTSVHTRSIGSSRPRFRRLGVETLEPRQLLALSVLAPRFLPDAVANRADASQTAPLSSHPIDVDSPPQAAGYGWRPHGNGGSDRGREWVSNALGQSWGINTLGGSPATTFVDARPSGALAANRTNGMFVPIVSYVIVVSYNVPGRSSTGVLTALSSGGGFVSAAVLPTPFPVPPAERASLALRTVADAYRPTGGIGLGEGEAVSVVWPTSVPRGSFLSSELLAQVYALTAFDELKVTAEWSGPTRIASLTAARERCGEASVSGSSPFGAGGPCALLVRMSPTDRDRMASLDACFGSDGEDEEWIALADGLDSSVLSRDPFYVQEGNLLVPGPQAPRAPVPSRGGAGSAATTPGRAPVRQFPVLRIGASNESVAAEDSHSPSAEEPSRRDALRPPNGGPTPQIRAVPLDSPNGGTVDGMLEIVSESSRWSADESSGARARPLPGRGPTEVEVIGLCGRDQVFEVAEEIDATTVNGEAAGRNEPPAAGASPVENASPTS